MPGNFAARLGDPFAGTNITMGSMTILIGFGGASAPTHDPCVKANPCKCGNTGQKGSPVLPLLGAKVLVDETDFALPCAALPLIWSRTYSSYVNAERGGACGLLGYGWYLSSCDMRIELQSGRPVFFDDTGRMITFMEPLPPGGILYSPNEDLWLLRGGEGAPVPWRAEGPAFAHVPP
ncbi:MAG: DUF6531 domain-containing protein, partial [Betaproteobacteria bacterium]|nr:DUF6531 domain-containing protein [Betaproteobacteria bacterium]